MNSKKYYSQYGQDFFVDSILKRKKYIVEVGCIDGLKFSNSLFFEKQYESNCYLFEPHKQYKKLILQNRPKSYFRDYAISDHNTDKGKFFASKRGSYSNLSSEFETLYNSSEFFDGYEIQEHIKVRTLNFCFDELELKQIDFLSIDIDGNDLLAIKGLDLKKYKPEIICIEMGDKQRDFKIYLDYFKSHSSYKYFIVFRRDFFAFKKLIYLIKALFINKTINLYSTPHPLDNEKEITIGICKVSGLKMLNETLEHKYFFYKKLTKKIINYLISTKKLIKKLIF